ncbi:MAG: hypothetical protein IH614_13510, partial [Desulfuromonadales bacterium]|nr:hypothetical protein [Desulfuromonadales bacterium]
MSRPTIDRLFLALLLLDATVTALFLARAGLGVIGSVLSIGTVTGGLVPGLVAIKFLLNSVLLLGAARRQAPLAGPSQAFLLLAAGGFLCLALGLGRGFLTAAWTQAPLAGLLPG